MLKHVEAIDSSDAIRGFTGKAAYSIPSYLVFQGLLMVVLRLALGGPAW